MAFTMLNKKPLFSFRYFYFTFKGCTVRVRTSEISAVNNSWIPFLCKQKDKRTRHAGSGLLAFLILKGLGLSETTSRW